MAEQLAKAIALPGRVPPVRFPSFPSLERTAVMGFNANFTLTAGAGDTKLMLTRSPVYPMWADTTAPSTTAIGQSLNYGVSSVFNNLPAIAAGDVPSDGVTVMPLSNNGAWHQGTTVGNGWPLFINGGGAVWPTRRAVLGSDPATGDVLWTWIPAGSYMLITQAALPYAFESQVTIEAWSGPGQAAWWSTTALTAAAANTSAGAAIAVTFGRWYRISSAVIKPQGAGVTVTPTISMTALVTSTVPTYTPSSVAGTWNVSTGTMTSTYFLPATISPEIDNSLLPWSATRLTAVAALLTNTTKVLNKEGTALWGRINPVLTNPFTAGYADVQQLHPAEKAFMDLEQGCYVYNPPSTDIARMDPQVTRLSTTLLYPVYDLSNTAFVAVGFLTDPDGGTSMAVNLDYHLEFKTSSTLFQIGVATTTLEALHTAQIALLKHGFFFHNADHTAMITSIISALASLHPLLRVAAPLAKGLYQSTSYALKSRPTAAQRPKTTSGQRSGIVPPPQPRTARRPKRAKARRAAPQPKPPARRGKMRSGLDMYLESRNTGRV